MTNVLKFTVSWKDRTYREHEEIMLLPLVVNGLFFFKHDDNKINPNVVPIVGNVFDGDLTVEYIDMDYIPMKDAKDLIRRSNIEPFEAYLEIIEVDMDRTISSKDKVAQDAYNKTIRKIYDFYNAPYKENGMRTLHIYEPFIEYLTARYITRHKTITICQHDYDKVMKLLQANHIKTY